MDLTLTEERRVLWSWRTQEMEGHHSLEAGIYPLQSPGSLETCRSPCDPTSQEGFLWTHSGQQGWDPLSTASCSKVGNYTTNHSPGPRIRVLTASRSHITSRIPAGPMEMQASSSNSHIRLISWQVGLTAGWISWIFFKRRNTMFLHLSVVKKIYTYENQLWTKVTL